MENNNLNTMIKYYPYLEKIRDKDDDIEIYLDRSQKNENIFAVKKHNYIYYLNSRYDVEKEADIISDHIIENKNPFAPILVFGIGNGAIIKRIKDKYPENMIYVHEPSISVFKTCITNINNISEFIEKNIIYTVGGEMNGACVETLHFLIDYANFTLTNIVCSPQYKTIMYDEYIDFLKLYYTRCEEIMIGSNTKIWFEKSHILNFWKNLKDMLQQYSVDGLVNAFKDIAKDDMPVFLVSAGPSLDKNAELLKEIKGRGIIMAVDTALKPLMKRGIIPDITASVDPCKDMELFEYEGIEKIPILADITSNYKVIEKNKGMHFYEWDGNAFIKELMQEYGIELSITESGGSVACNLLSLALLCGFKRIIFVGQDLAYPNGNIHSSGSYEEEDKIDVNDNNYFEVEDIYGNKVYTERNMNSYRKWFEAVIQRKPDVKFSDATEGGAKINGTEILTLSEAISKYCSSIEPINVRPIIASSQKIFTTEQRQSVFEKIVALLERMDDLDGRLEDMIKNIERTEKKITAREINEISKFIRELMEFNTELEDSLEIKLLNIYDPQMERLIDSMAYQIQEKQEDEVKLVLSISKLLYESYREAIINAKKDMEQYFLNLK